jgi:outer membrane protein assembly factor BamE (lipoprotein component of BamABCDE complex)
MSSTFLGRRGMELRGLAAWLLLLGATTACVTENKTTGEMVPRGNQKYPFEQVEKAAERLEPGMEKMQVLLLLGSPAETDESGNVWVYLPERYGVLIPARALRLEFGPQGLVEHGYRPIVLGARL